MHCDLRFLASRTITRFSILVFQPFWRPSCVGCYLVVMLWNGPSAWRGKRQGSGCRSCHVVEWIAQFWSSYWTSRTSTSYDVHESRVIITMSNVVESGPGMSRQSRTSRRVGEGAILEVQEIRTYIRHGLHSGDRLHNLKSTYRVENRLCGSLNSRRPPTAAFSILKQKTIDGAHDACRCDGFRMPAHQQTMVPASRGRATLALGHVL